MTTVLNIIETPYRATIEEQDDTILWLANMMKRGGLDVTVLLRASAVNYGVNGQDASGLRIGDIEIVHPPTIDRDVAGLLQAGVAVYFVEEDAAERGIREDTLIDGMKPVKRRQLPSLLEGYEQVWHW
ncbi:MAG TPA: hypothetical protein VGQ20_08985 [Acidimicrobiales bacterium]|jgi:predicted peroxiredoxin|nr:hypothetical protein [Acidimicrobiales bacterium]